MLTTSSCIVKLLLSCGVCFSHSYACPGPCQNPLVSYCNVGTKKGCASNHIRLGIPSLKPFGTVWLERNDRIFEGQWRNLRSLTKMSYFASVLVQPGYYTGWWCNTTGDLHICSYVLLHWLCASLYKSLNTCHFFCLKFQPFILTDILTCSVLTLTKRSDD